MNEQRLTAAFAALEPSQAMVERLGASILAELEARAVLESPLPSLTREWLDLLARRPVANTVLVAAAAFTLVLTTPLLALPFLFLS